MTTDPPAMTTRLKKFYVLLLLPAVSGFALACLIRAFHPPAAGTGQLASALAPVIFILAALTAVAGPILYRSVFAHRRRHLSETASGDLLRFERNILALSISAAYLALIAFWLQLPRFHLVGILLLALYAAYTAYPSNRRIGFDTRVFRCRDAVPGRPVGAVKNVTR